MNNLKSVCLWVTIALALGSCSTISYSPKLTLDVSPVTINKKLRVEKFTDSTPASDHKTPFMGLALTSPDAMSGGLDLEVSNAIANDFAVNGLFASAARKLDDADYIMTGEIRRFMGISKANTYSKVSLFTFLTGELVFLINPTQTTGSIFLLSAVPTLIAYFGVPVRYNMVGVELEVKVKNRVGEVIGTYRSSYSERQEMNMYHNRSLAITTMSNKAFSTVVGNIRRQIIADQQKYQ